MNILPEEIKRVLNEQNGHSKEYYEDKVRAAVREEMFPEDEIAILRKAVAKLFQLVSYLHPDEINNAEFAEYNALVENIKKNVKKRIICWCGIKYAQQAGQDKLF